MGKYTSYYLYQKYEKIGSQDWTPVYPQTLSVYSDGTESGSTVIKNDNDTACGYKPSTEVQYRWVKLNPSTDYICDNCELWVASGYICDNGDLYEQLNEQNFDGKNWYYTGVKKKGKLLEKNSKNCTGDTTGSTTGSTTGETTSSMKVTYTDGSTKYFTGLTSIEKDTDSNKKNAKEVEIYDGVKSIGDSAFIRCSGLTSIIIPESVTSIGAYAFQNCSSLTSITIPDSVTSIDKGVFANCESLTGITIPTGVTIIDTDAFSYCSSLTGITIPNSVTSIGNGAFYGCSSLSSITVDTGNTVFDSRDNCNAIIRTADNTLIVGCYATVIPNSVTSIGSHAFFVCTSLSSITIPDSVTSIDKGVFANCESLSSITIPESVTNIGNGAFYGCSSLSSVTIPNGVTSIDDWTFYSCSSLVTVTIKNSKNKIAYGYNAFRGIASSAKLYVPSNLLADYQADSNWTKVFKGGIYPIS